MLTAFLDYTWAKCIEYFHLTGQQRRKKIALIASLVFDLGMLGVFKYSGFVVENINLLTGLSLPVPQIALPIGISFYTFQTISYVLDVYRGQVAAQKRYYKYLMYLSSYHQLVAGPIVRYSDVAAEIENRTVSAQDFSEGITRFCLGLTKKVVVANVAGSLAGNYLDADLASLSVAGAWFGVLLYTLQIYYDFSAYSDMAIGLGRMFGFHYHQNFNYPYIAKSVTEFWRRWHISLSSFFRDYVYIPLGGNKGGLAKQLSNIAIVWLLTGFWHGASWKYVAFGFWNGMVILVSTLLQPVSDKVVAALHIERKSAWYQVFSMLRTFVVVLIGYYFDIADGFRAAMGMMLKSVTDLHLSQLRPGAVLEALPLTRYDWCVLLFGTVVIFTASVIQERSQRTIREILDEKCLALRWAVLLAGIFAVVLMGVYGPGVQASEFVYMQF